MQWDDAARSLLDKTFAAFAEPVQVNAAPISAIVWQEMVEIGDYASVTHELRWRIYAKKTDINTFARQDAVTVGGKQFRVEAPDTDDGYEITAWLREV